MEENTKFKVGELVRVKKDLIVGVKYYNDGNMMDGETFSSRMRNNLGKEGRIIQASKYGYRIDIDPMHVYTDGMIEYPYDELALKDYEYNKEVESLVNHMLIQHYKGLIDKALDEKMHVTDPEGFQRLVNLLNHRL